MQLDSFASLRLKQLQDKINKERKEAGLKPLTQSEVVGEVLENIAAQQLVYIASVFVRN